MTQRFEHQVSFLPMPYHHDDEKFLVFKKAGPPTKPDIDRFLSGNVARRHMAQYEAQGFELVSVQAVLEGVVRQMKAHGPGPWGFAYSVTAGFTLFWRKHCRTDAVGNRPSITQTVHLFPSENP